MPADGDQRHEAACCCERCHELAEAEAGLFDLVEDGVLALHISEGRMVFREAYEGALATALDRTTTAV